MPGLCSVRAPFNNTCDIGGKLGIENDMAETFLSVTRNRICRDDALFK